MEDATKLISCFNVLLIDYIQQGERGEVVNFNSIKSGLNILINISEKDGPLEAMSMIYGIMPEIISVINEKSDDFSTDILMVHEAQENFEKRFEEGLSSAPNQESVADFFSFIKEKKLFMKSDISLRKNVQKLIHDQKERCG